MPTAIQILIGALIVGSVICVGAMVYSIVSSYFEDCSDPVNPPFNENPR